MGAVTGDGVNDALALREAAIGVAMGRSSTDVAREAADLVLADNNFATAAEAVHTGRVLYANLRKAVHYYLAAKVSLVSSSLAAVLLKLPVPFDPVQIIVMELFMELGAAVLLAYPAAVGGWMIGHLVLATHMRAERQTLLRTNPLANRPFLGWAPGRWACSSSD